MTDIDLDQLAAVCGGMQWENFPRSTNVEDLRGLSQAESMKARVPASAPLPKPQRYEGDLPSQAGLDDLNVLGSRYRRRL